MEAVSRYSQIIIAAVSFVLLTFGAFAQTTPPCAVAGDAGNSYENCSGNDCERMVCNGTAYVPLEIWSKTSGTINSDLGNDTSTCDTTRSGRMRWTGTDLQICTGTAWSTIAIYNTANTPNPGNSGNQNPTACNVSLGASCGGGIYVGDTNLVFARSGCRPCGGGGQPACAVTGDNYICDGLYADNNALVKPYVYLSAGADDGTGFPTYSSGWAATEALKGPVARAAINFCANLITNGYSDWFLPLYSEWRLANTGWRDPATITWNGYFSSTWISIGSNGAQNYVPNMLSHSAMPNYYHARPLTNAATACSSGNQDTAYWTISPEPTNACTSYSQCLFAVTSSPTENTIFANSLCNSAQSGLSFRHITLSLKKSEKNYVRCARRN